MINSLKNEKERVPRADRLNIVRDFLHLLSNNDGILTLKKMFNETCMHITPPISRVWEMEPFNEYVMFLRRLKLARISQNVIRIMEKGKSLVVCSEFGKEKLHGLESQIFKSLLLSYSPFRKFLEVGFCDGQSFRNTKDLFAKSKCPSRRNLLYAYTRTYNQRDDREARTMLYWGFQIFLIEFDDYTKQFFLVNPRILEQRSFINQLRQSYNKVRDEKSGIALIPLVRFLSCCALKIHRDTFDNYLLELYREQPLVIHLGKASISRPEVLKYGVTDMQSYYYYIRIGETQK